MQKPLSESIALVTGASRGVGRGIAVGLGEAGATVYVTGRTSTSREAAGREGTVEETAKEVSRAGGTGVPVVCDHTVDEEVERLFQRIRSGHGRMDVLVNNVWGGYERMFLDGEYVWEHSFWDLPLSHWDRMFDAGVRAHYAASRLAAPMMVRQGEGLIVNISFWAAQKYVSNVAYGVAKAATDKMTADMAHELQPHGATVVSLYPGLVRTERVMAAAEHLDLSESESPVFVGRAVSALAGDDRRHEMTGEVLTTAALARKYGFRDLGGESPSGME